MPQRPENSFVFISAGHDVYSHILVLILVPPFHLLNMNTVEFVTLTRSVVLEKMQI
jgi:hypothetical protein